MAKTLHVFKGTLRMSLTFDLGKSTQSLKSCVTFEVERAALGYL